MLKQILKITSLLIPLTIVTNFSPSSVLAKDKIINITTPSEQVSVIDSKKTLIHNSRDGRYLFFYDQRPILVDTIEGDVEQIGTDDYPASRNIDITDDGRYIVYSSYGLGIVVYDRKTKQYRNVVEDDDRNGGRVSISGSGRYIVFDTKSKYLERIIPEKLIGQQGSTSGSPSYIFLYDTVEDKLQLISKSYDGQKSANKPSTNGKISRDGKFIVFQSKATDLLSPEERKKLPINPYIPVNPVTGEPTYLSGYSRFYIYERQTGVKRMVEGQFVSMSDDGRYYAFRLDRNKKDKYNNVAIYDHNTGAVKTLSDKANNFSGSPQITGDGRYVIFTTKATNLDTSIDMRPAKLKNTGLISILHDLQTGTNKMLTINDKELKAISDKNNYFEYQRINQNKGNVCGSVRWFNNNGSQILCTFGNSSFLVYALKNGVNLESIEQPSSDITDSNTSSTEEQNVSLPKEGTCKTLGEEILCRENGKLFNPDNVGQSSGENENRNNSDSNNNPLDAVNETTNQINKTRRTIDNFMNLFRQ